MERAYKLRKEPLIDAFYGSDLDDGSMQMPSRVVLARACGFRLHMPCRPVFPKQHQRNDDARARQTAAFRWPEVVAARKETCERLIACESVENPHYFNAPFLSFAPVDEMHANEFERRAAALWRVCADVIITMVKFDYQASRCRRRDAEFILSGVASSAVLEDVLVLAQSMWIQAACPQDHNTSCVAAASLRLLALNSSDQVLKLFVTLL